MWKDAVVLLISAFLPFYFLLSLVLRVSFASPPEGDTIETQLKAAVEAAQTKMPPLDPWQKVLYTEEVIPQFQRFIRDYQRQKDKVKVEIDYDSLRHYLMFHGPTTLKQTDPRILVLLKWDTSCNKCTESSGEIEKLVRARLDKRGLIPIWLSADEFGPQLSGNVLADRVAGMEKERNAIGTLTVEWSPAPMDNIDTAHADEKRYVIHSFLQIGDISKQTRQKEVFDNDSFETTEARLLTDIFTDLGAKIEWEQANLNELGKEEVLIEVSGIKDYEQYVRIKASLSTQLKDVSSLVDRKFSKSQVVFAVYTSKKKADLKKQLSELSLDPQSQHSFTVVVP